MPICNWLRGNAHADGGLGVTARTWKQYDDPLVVRSEWLGLKTKWKRPEVNRQDVSVNKAPTREWSCTPSQLVNSSTPFCGGCAVPFYWYEVAKQMMQQKKKNGHNEFRIESKTRKIESCTQSNSKIVPGWLDADDVGDGEEPRERNNRQLMSRLQIMMTVLWV